MVQFKHSVRPIIWWPPGDGEGSFDPTEYWKFDCPERPRARELKQFLTTVGFYFKSSVNTDRLLKLLSRQQRCLLSYDAYTAKELKSFYAGRQLTAPAGSSKGDLVHVLEEADEHVTFELLFDLPPELRNRIYSIHFDMYKELRLPTTPPITQANRQLRQETLTLFYKTSQVVINVSGVPYDPTQNPRIWEHDHPGHFGQPTPETITLFEGLSQQYLGNIRRVRLAGIVATPTHWIDALWDLDLGKGKSPIAVSAIDGTSDIIRVRWITPYHVAPMRDLPAARDRYELRVKAGLEDIMAREGNLKLRRDDLKLFTRMFLPMNEE